MWNTLQDNDPVYFLDQYHFKKKGKNGAFSLNDTSEV